MNDFVSPGASSAGEPRADGLPPIAPDIVEQEGGDEFDDIVPTQGYHMLPVVGLGGSAGSIPALQRFFSRMPAETGMAFVVVLHLAAEHASIMDEILARSTAMPVVQAQDQQDLQPNTVYVIPPGQFLSAAKGRLRLTPIEPERGRRVAVDLFFRTLADTHGPNAVAIVLSGADGDGALGIKRIKERGGLTIAQAPEEAEHPSMPRSAIDTGMVDWILPVEEMAARLLEYRANGARLQLPAEEGPPPAKASSVTQGPDEKALREVLAHVRSRTGRDFSAYKRATVLRRLARRMQVNGAATLPEYLGLLRKQPEEAGALRQDLLISVTNFFRDREAFDALERELPGVFSGKGPGDAVRVWTAGCATGEEAYSIAMLLLEQVDRLDSPPVVQVFATDLAEEAIAAARDGLYPFTIEADVSAERLRRFFTKEHSGYRARRELRECLLFAVHDLLKDAPFSRMDLFTCRNLLIYLTAEAQDRVYATAHFSLRPGGLLFIGSSELVDEESGQWRVVDKKHRLYRQRPGTRPELPVPIGPGTLARAFEAQERARGGPYILGTAFTQQSAAAVRQTELEREGRKISWEELHFKLIERFAPPSLIVTRDYDIVHVSENAGRFLHFHGGEPSVNLLKVVHPMLRVELRAALFRAAQANVPIEVFRLPLELDGEAVLVDLRVAPAQEIAPDYLLVVFSVREKADTQSMQMRQEAEPAVRHLERENEQLKTRLRETIEQYEAAGEEQKASTEELQAMNEELRSSAEELETSREELQSVNEELTTVNQELKGKVDDLAHANSDLANLMAANGVATIFLDRMLAITRYTPTAVLLFRLIPTDLGRPLTDLSHRLNYPELRSDAEQVLNSLTPTRREVTDGQRWFLAQLLPYRTDDDRIAGVVLTFLDISETRLVELALRSSEQKLRTLADAVPQIIWANDAAGAANYFNQRWYEFTGLTYEQSFAVGWEAIVHPDDALASQERWALAQAAGEAFETEYRLRGADGTYRWFIGRNVPVYDETHHVTGWFGTATDIQALKEAEAAVRANEEQFRRAIEDAPIPVIMHAEDGQVLQISKTWTELTGYTPGDMPTFEAWLKEAYGERAEEVRTQISRLFQGEQRLRDAEVEIRTRSGERRQWSFSASAPGRLRDGRGFIVAMAIDVTDRARAAAALHESQERLRLAQEAGEIGIWDWDLATGRSYWSETLWRLFGHAKPHPGGTEPVWQEQLVPADRRRMAENLSRLLQSAENDFRDWFRIQRTDGELRWIESIARITRDTEGRAVRMLGVNIDVTERKNSEAQLAASEERLRLIVENAREYAIFSLSLDRHIVSWNSGAQAILGYTAGEAYGQSGDIIFTPEDRAAGAPEREAALALADGRAPDERWHVRKDGTRFWGSGVMMSMHDAQGEAIGLVKVFRDHTEQLRAKQALEKGKEELWAALQETERARAQAEAAGKAKDHFLAVLSHELRTPLTPVLMATRVLSRDQTLSPAARESLGMIERNIRLESRFIEDLLDLTRIERGKLEITRAPVHLHEIIRHAMEVAQSDLEAKQQRLELSLDAVEDHLLGDATRLQQVFWNLLKNASKFSPVSTTIRVRSRNEPNAILVDVIDQGIGFDAEVAERIFEAFTQANQEITREFGGLGLGLSISRASVAAHGGIIRASSPGRNQGAMFTVQLTLAE